MVQFFIYVLRVQVQVFLQFLHLRRQLLKHLHLTLLVRVRQVISIVAIILDSFRLFLLSIITVLLLCSCLKALAKPLVFANRKATTSSKSHFQSN